jgi:hypothetical protein
VLIAGDAHAQAGAAQRRQAGESVGVEVVELLVGRDAGRRPPCLLGRQVEAGPQDLEDPPVMLAARDHGRA